MIWHDNRARWGDALIKGLNLVGWIRSKNDVAGLGTLPMVQQLEMGGMKNSGKKNDGF